MLNEACAVFLYIDAVIPDTGGNRIISAIKIDYIFAVSNGGFIAIHTHTQPNAISSE